MSTIFHFECQNHLPSLATWCSEGARSRVVFEMREMQLHAFTVQYILYKPLKHYIDAYKMNFLILPLTWAFQNFDVLVQGSVQNICRILARTMWPTKLAKAPTHNDNIYNIWSPYCISRKDWGDIEFSPLWHLPQLEPDIHTDTIPSKVQCMLQTRICVPYGMWRMPSSWNDSTVSQTSF